MNLQDCQWRDYDPLRGQSQFSSMTTAPAATMIAASKRTIRIDDTVGGTPDTPALAGGEGRQRFICRSNAPRSAFARTPRPKRIRVVEARCRRHRLGRLL